MKPRYSKQSRRASILYEKQGAAGFPLLPVSDTPGLPLKGNELSLDGLSRRKGPFSFQYFLARTVHANDVIPVFHDREAV